VRGRPGSKSGDLITASVSRSPILEPTRGLADEANEAVPSPRTRLAAAQLTALVRVLTSAEVRAFVARRPAGDDRTALADWIEQAARMTADGLGDYRPGH
jgi:hypothetical protein